MDPFETVNYLFEQLVEDSLDLNPLNASRAKRMRQMCETRLIHLMKTDLYFLVNPTRLGVIVFYNVIVQTLPNINAGKLELRLKGLGIDLSCFMARDGALLGEFRFSEKAFTKSRHAKAMKKFSRFLSRGYSIVGHGCTVSS